MRGGILSFSTNKRAKNEKDSNSEYTKSFFTNFIQKGNIKQRKTN